MRRLRFLLSMIVMTCLGSGFALDGMRDETVLKGLQAAPEQFSTLLSLFDSAGLTEILQSTGPITVLAPTNAAFEKLDPTIYGLLQSDPEGLVTVLKGLILPHSLERLGHRPAPLHATLTRPSQRW